jgi:hypothetical protein
MQRLEFSGAVRPLSGSLGVKGLISTATRRQPQTSDKELHTEDTPLRTTILH